jgi:hypothetical protein
LKGVFTTAAAFIGGAHAIPNLQGSIVADAPVLLDSVQLYKIRIAATAYAIAIVLWFYFWQRYLRQPVVSRIRPFALILDKFADPLIRLLSWNKTLSEMVMLCAPICFWNVDFIGWFVLYGLFFGSRVTAVFSVFFWLLNGGFGFSELRPNALMEI